MPSIQDAKFVNVIPPGAIKDNAAFTEIEIDTLDYNYCTIVFALGATDIAMAGLAVQETDSSGSGEANVTGLIVGTSDDMDGTTSVLPSATDDNQVTVFHIDCRKRKRYLSLLATAGDGAAGTYAAAIAILTRGDVSPTSSTGFADGGVLIA